MVEAQLLDLTAARVTERAAQVLQAHEPLVAAARSDLSEALAKIESRARKARAYWTDLAPASAGALELEALDGPDSDPYCAGVIPVVREGR